MIEQETALVRLMDTPLFTTLIMMRAYGINYERLNPDILLFMLRAGPITFRVVVDNVDEWGWIGANVAPGDTVDLTP